MVNNISMGNNLFLTDEFFDTSEFPFAEIFDKQENAWEVLKRLNSFIISLFDKGIVKENYQGKKYVFVGDGSQVLDEALIIGPCVIGKNSVIGHASLLRENCLIGDNVHIGHGVEVKNSLFFNDSRASHLNYIGDSIIGKSVNIAGGAMLANYRFDQKSVIVKYQEEKMNTGLLKFGSIIADNCQIGVNAVLNPGTILGKGCVVYPLTSVRGVYEKNSVIK